MRPLRFYRLAGFTAASSGEFDDDAAYSVRKSIEMGLAVASGADKDTFNAQYSTLPDDVAANVAVWKGIQLPVKPEPQKIDIAATSAKGLAIAAAIVAAGVFFARWKWPEGHLTRKR